MLSRRPMPVYGTVYQLPNNKAVPNSNIKVGGSLSLPGRGLQLSGSRGGAAINDDGYVGLSSTVSRGGAMNSAVMGDESYPGAGLKLAGDRSISTTRYTGGGTAEKWLKKNRKNIALGAALGAAALGTAGTAAAMSAGSPSSSGTYEEDFAKWEAGDIYAGSGEEPTPEILKKYIPKPAGMPPAAYKFLIKNIIGAKKVVGYVTNLLKKGMGGEGVPVSSILKALGTAAVKLFIYFITHPEQVALFWSGYEAAGNYAATVLEGAAVIGAGKSKAGKWLKKNRKNIEIGTAIGATAAGTAAGLYAYNQTDPLKDIQIMKPNFNEPSSQPDYFGSGARPDIVPGKKVYNTALINKLAARGLITKEMADDYNSGRISNEGVRKTVIAAQNYVYQPPSGSGKKKKKGFTKKQILGLVSIGLIPFGLGTAYIAGDVGDDLINTVLIASKAYANDIPGEGIGKHIKKDFTKKAWTDFGKSVDGNYSQPLGEAALATRLLSIGVPELAPVSMALTAGSLTAQMAGHGNKNKSKRYMEPAATKAGGKRVKRAPSAYNKHVQREMLLGKTMKQAAVSWKKANKGKK